MDEIVLENLIEIHKPNIILTPYEAGRRKIEAITKNRV